jgi:hypothetical protein
MSKSSRAACVRRARDLRQREPDRADPDVREWEIAALDAATSVSLDQYS